MHSTRSSIRRRHERTERTFQALGLLATVDEVPLWRPSTDRVAGANLTAFIKHIQKNRPAGSAGMNDFASLYRWSVDHPEAFWPEVWRFCGVIADERPGREPWDRVVVGLDRMAPPDARLGPRWFPGARLNFAENLLRYADDQPAIVFWNERGRQRQLSYAELKRQVAALAGAPLQPGHPPRGPGPRVLPHPPA